MTIPAQKFAFDSAYNLQQCAIVIRSAAVTATKCTVEYNGLHVKLKQKIHRKLNGVSACFP